MALSGHIHLFFFFFFCLFVFRVFSLHVFIVHELIHQHKQNIFFQQVRLYNKDKRYCSFWTLGTMFLGDALLIIFEMKVFIILKELKCCPNS